MNRVGNAPGSGGNAATLLVLVPGSPHGLSSTAVLIVLALIAVCGFGSAPWAQVRRR
ncbi:hypothetical protein [Candidatus Frankia alpina]|uniref:hypothetical protein n=1 Tax=Candidatus Frankia alpina TaxID=2699483 RepID=UPI0013868E8C|nr:hypothetical protein [Candidatus Frankia alpina]